MDREEYINQIEAQRAYCDCPSLAELKKQGRITSVLEEVCEGFEKKRQKLETMGILKYKLEDVDTMLNYYNRNRDLNKALREYQDITNQLTKNKKLRLTFHKLTPQHNTFTPTETISTRKAKVLFQKEEPIITMHCSDCDQLIERILEID